MFSFAWVISSTPLFKPTQSQIEIAGYVADRIYGYCHNYEKIVYYYQYYKWAGKYPFQYINGGMYGLVKKATH